MTATFRGTTSLLTCGCCIADGWTHITTTVAGRTWRCLQREDGWENVHRWSSSSFHHTWIQNSKTNAENGSLARVTRSRASSNYLLQINASSFGKSLIASNASRRGITIWREHCPAPRRTPLAASSLCWDVDRWQFVHSDLLFQDRWKLWPVTSFAGSLMIFNASRLLHDVLCCLHGGWSFMQSFLASCGDRVSE